MHACVRACVNACVCVCACVCEYVQRACMYHVYVHVHHVYVRVCMRGCVKYAFGSQRHKQAGSDLSMTPHPPTNPQPPSTPPPDLGNKITVTPMPLICLCIHLSGVTLPLEQSTQTCISYQINRSDQPLKTEPELEKTWARPDSINLIKEIQSNRHIDIYNCITVARH